MVEPLTPRVVAIWSSPEPASAAKRICARLSLRAACRPPLKSAVSSSCSDWLRSTRYRTFIRASWRSKPEMNLQMNQIFGENAPASQRRFTTTQGQYLAFIYAYTRVLGRPPAEADMQRHFGVSPALRPPNGAHSRASRADPPAARGRSQHRSTRCSRTSYRRILVTA